MSSRPSLVPAIGVAAFLALLTGVGSYLAGGRPLVALIGLVGALVAGAAVLILLPEDARPASEPVVASGDHRNSLAGIRSRAGRKGPPYNRPRPTPNQGVGPAFPAGRAQRRAGLYGPPKRQTGDF